MTMRDVPRHVRDFGPRVLEAARSHDIGRRVLRS